MKPAPPVITNFRDVIYPPPKEDRLSVALEKTALILGNSSKPLGRIT